jgi:hypothetical protein
LDVQNPIKVLRKLNELLGVEEDGLHPVNNPQFFKKEK